MIEIEFSALSRQCLNRRIAGKEELTREIMALIKEREEQAIKIDLAVLERISQRQVESALSASQR
jgi:hypothetical protein